MNFALLVKPHAYVSRFRRADLTPLQTTRGRRDLAALVRLFPALSHYQRLAEPARQRLAPLHGVYVSTISDDIMAASLELSIFIQVFAGITRPARIADLGSGFSSLVLRDYARRADHDVEVSSVDDHPGWLTTARNYLTDQGHNADRLIAWNEFAAKQADASFDFILHDLGSMSFRTQTLNRVLDLARPGGFVILDDVHKPDYRAYAEVILSKRSLQHWSLKALTCDHRARYSYLVCL